MAMLRSFQDGCRHSSKSDITPGVWVLAFWRLVECIFDFYVFAVLKE
jgi:hypothetical protein